ncbi:hypothetical protein [Synechococcus sp. M16CYN]|uniref:hypothetical protein n=1 Tax=Synechococcus sp. M16CYN TaxID=3103139 RepID=UPI00333F75D8
MTRVFCCYLAALLWFTPPTLASPGLCTGSVYAEGITQIAKNHWQLFIKFSD